MIMFTAPLLVRNSSPRIERASAGLTDAVFALAALLPLLLIASLFAIVALAGTSAQARAETPATCVGKNLVTEMQAENPALYAQITAAAEETIYGDAMLFKVEKPGSASKPNYLFGTMHLTDNRVTSLPDFARAALEMSTTVAIETTDVLDEQKAAAAVMSRPDLTMFPGDTRLSDFLDADEKTLVKDMLAREGMQLALIEKMKPWLISSMLALPDCEMARKEAGVEILDIGLARQAEESGKTIVGLETMVEQLDAINSIPDEVHVRGLIDTLRIADDMDDLIETMIVLYVNGKVGEIWPLMRAYSEQYAGDGKTPEASAEAEAGYVAFEEAMITVRNKTMLVRSLPLLAEGGAFIAVGALHLPGENGLAKLFADAGYTVSPIRK